MRAMTWPRPTGPRAAARCLTAALGTATGGCAPDDPLDACARLPDSVDVRPAAGASRHDFVVSVDDRIGRDALFVTGDVFVVAAHATSDACRVGIFAGPEQPPPGPAVAPELTEPMPARLGDSDRVFEGVLPPALDGGETSIGLAGVRWRDTFEREPAPLIDPDYHEDALWLTVLCSCDDGTLTLSAGLVETQFRCPDTPDWQLTLSSP